jgi:hypothetical protein
VNGLAALYQLYPSITPTVYHSQSYPNRTTGGWSFGLVDIFVLCSLQQFLDENLRNVQVKHFSVSQIGKKKSAIPQSTQTSEVCPQVIRFPPVLSLATRPVPFKFTPRLPSQHRRTWGRGLASTYVKCSPEQPSTDKTGWHRYVAPRSR